MKSLWKQKVLKLILAWHRYFGCRGPKLFMNFAVVQDAGIIFMSLHRKTRMDPWAAAFEWKNYLWQHPPRRYWLLRLAGASYLQCPASSGTGPSECGIWICRCWSKRLDKLWKLLSRWSVQSMVKELRLSNWWGMPSDGHHASAQGYKTGSVPAVELTPSDGGEYVDTLLM